MERAEERQIKKEELHLLEDNQMFRLLLTRLQALQSNKRREQREAAFKNEADKAFGCEWALWGLEQTDIILAQLRAELKDRAETTITY
jgi:hypothetical protein